MKSFHDNDSDSSKLRSTQTRENEERLRQEELATLLAFWSDSEPIVDAEVSRRLCARERDCERILSGSLDLVGRNPNMIWSNVADALQELHVARLRLKTYDVKKIRETSSIWRSLVAFDKRRASSLALALTSFGRIYCLLERYADAEEACLEATSLYREIFAANPKEGRESSFFTMICLAEVYFATSRYDDAERALRMASGFLKKISVDVSRHKLVLDRIRRKLSERSQAFGEGETKKNDARLRDEALNFCRDASRLWRWGGLQEAETLYLNAISIYRKPSSLENDVERRACLAETLDELGRLRCQPKLSKYEDAEACFTESASILRELSSFDRAYSDAFTAVLLNLAEYFERQKRWKELEQTLREALKALGANDEAFNPIAPSARVRLANLLRRSNRAEEAIEEYRRALELWDKAQGGVASRYRLEIATARFRSAELLKRAKRWDEAEESYDVAQKLFRELSESDLENESYVRKLASSLNNLATLRSNSERGSKSVLDYMVAERNYYEASTLYRRLREKNPNSVEFEFATTLYDSAALHEKLNVVDKAEKEYLEALEIQRALAKAKPEEHAENVARTLNSLAAFYRSNASDPLRFEKAEPLYEEALRVYENLERAKPKTYGRKIVRTLRSLASLHLQDPDRKELAEEEYRRAVTLLSDLTRRFPDVAGYKSDLADVYLRLGAVRFEFGSFHDATLCYREAIAKYKELTRNNPRKYSVKLAETFVELSDLHQKSGAFDDALQALESSVAVYEKASREEPTDETLKLKLATACYRLGTARQKLNQDERAKESYLANLSILRELAREKPTLFRLDMARTHNNLAILSRKLNRIEEAEIEYKAAVGLYREMESDEYDACKNDLIKTLNNLAILYRESGRLVDAEKNFVDALAIRRELAEENPPEYKPLLANFLFNFSSFYYDQGRLREAESYCREATAIFEEYASNDEQRRNFERASAKLRGIRDEIEEREINEAFVAQSDEYSEAAAVSIRERVARVYVSSVEDDARAERNYLAQEIFPRISVYCKRRGVEFVPLDLRLGETDATDDARVLTFGLQEIARTRPFFIGLLGDEYGRILPSSTLEQFSEFKRVVLSEKESNDARMSALEAEFQFGVMRETNKVDALFALRSSDAQRREGARREKPGTEPFKKLTILKRKTRAQKSHPTKEYKSLEELGAQVERALIAWIDRLFCSERDVRQARDDAQRTLDLRAFQNCAPNQSDVGALDSFLQSDSSALVVVGASGAGKSSLPANWSARIGREDLNRRVATYCVGANGLDDAPSNVLSFLTRALDSDDSNVDALRQTSTLEERARAFSGAVASFLKNDKEKNLIVVVDGLDRLVDVGGAKDLAWLPNLPKRAKYVLSTSKGGVAQSAFARLGWSVCELKPSPTNEPRLIDDVFNDLEAQIERKVDEGALCGASYRDFTKILALVAVSSCGLTLEELRRASGLSSLKLLAILDVLNCVLTVQRARFRIVDERSRDLALERCAKETPEARRLLIDLFKSDADLARRLEVPFQYFKLGDRKALKASLLNFDVFVALYDGTRACDFCKYWDAASDDERASADFGDFFKLDFSSKTNVEVGAYWRALGDVARSYQDDQTAEDAYCRALDALRESAWNDEFFVSLTRLASFCRERGRFEDAERTLHAGLEPLAAQNASGKLNASIGAVLLEISALCRRFGRFDEAEKLCSAATASLESTRDERGLSEATLESARVCRDLRRFDEARTKYEDVATWLRDRSSYDPFAFERRLAEVLVESSRALAENGNYEEAESRLREAESVWRESNQGSQESRDCESAAVLDELARLYCQADRTEEAETACREALRLRRKLEQASPAKYGREVAASIVSLASLHRRANRLSEADAEFQIALETYRDLAKEEPRAFKPKLAFVLKNLAELHDEFNRKTKADVEFNEAATIYRELNAETSSAFDGELVATLRRWAEFCRESNRASDAKAKYREIASLCSKSPVETRSEEYFNALTALAETMTQTGENDEASNVYCELIRAFCQKNALERAETARFADALSKSARLRFDAGDYAFAASEYEALATFVRALAESDFDAESEELRRARQTLLVAYDA